MRAVLALLIDRLLLFLYNLLVKSVVDVVKKGKDKKKQENNLERYQEAIKNDLPKEVQIDRAESLLNGSDSSNK